jgi:hypothetical protein
MPKKKVRTLKSDSVPILVGGAALELSANMVTSHLLPSRRET